MSRRTVSRTVECEAEARDVVALLSDAGRIPAWAPAFADAVDGDERSGWWVTKDAQRFLLRVVARPDAGTVDYMREIAPGREAGAYIRAFPRPGGGSVIVMTVPLARGADPATTTATLDDELAALARLVEQ